MTYVDENILKFLGINELAQLVRYIYFQLANLRCVKNGIIEVYLCTQEYIALA